MAGIKVVLVSGRTLRQGVGKEAGKKSERYRSSVAVGEMHPEDLKELTVKPGENVKITTDYGSVVVKSMSSTQLVQRGIIYVPLGPYASCLFGSKTDGSGMPLFKGVPAEVEAAPGERVRTFEELLAEV